MGHLGRLLVIGGGNMGGAIMRGVHGRFGVVVVEPDPARCGALAGVATCVQGVADGLRLVEVDAPVLLAVKPQVFEGVAAVGGFGDRLVVSVMAGVPIARIAARMDTQRVVRTMPNLPASIGLGITALAAGPGTRADDRMHAMELMRSVGEVVEIDEGMMDAFTALAGSGPAYLFFLAEVMVRAGREMGFDEETSRRIVALTVRGAAEMLAAGKDAAALRVAVTSPGGTTSAAMTVLESWHVREVWMKAIVAARDRGAELGR